MDPISLIFSIIILIMSVVLHELSHGYAAVALGDPTPRIQGRLTLNPLKHLDPVGSVIVPIVTSLFGFTFGWAKPVQWNPYNLKNKRTGEFLIAAAGPACNFLIAVIFGLLVRFAPFSVSFVEISYYVVTINVVLAIFNLVPLPPLDGSHILFSLLPPRLASVRTVIERYAIFFMLIALLVIWPLVSPLIGIIVTALTGV
ncbi:MAG: site-2 protease family protein [Candidatus Pacebacteria bacterium]|nr:site-2 protease family protein [Candidatus Paceibacterota bacterium]